MAITYDWTIPTVERNLADGGVMSCNIAMMPKHKIVEEVDYSIMGKDYTIPTVEYLQSDAMTSLIATVIKLHNRVQALEQQLEGASK